MQGLDREVLRRLGANKVDEEGEEEEKDFAGRLDGNDGVYEGGVKNPANTSASPGVRIASMMARGEDTTQEAGVEMTYRMAEKRLSAAARGSLPEIKSTMGRGSLTLTGRRADWGVANGDSEGGSDGSDDPPNESSSRSLSANIERGKASATRDAPNSPSSPREESVSSYSSRPPSMAFFGDTKRNLSNYSDRLARAAVYIRDAIHERPIKAHRNTGAPMKVYVFVNSWGWRWFGCFVSTVHLFLAFLEPASHRPFHSHPNPVDVFAPSPSPSLGPDLNGTNLEVVTYVNSFTNFATEKTMMTALYVEICILAFMTIDVCLNMYSLGLRDYFVQWHAVNDFTSRHFRLWGGGGKNERKGRNSRLDRQDRKEREREREKMRSTGLGKNIPLDRAGCAGVFLSHMNNVQRFKFFALALFVIDAAIACTSGLSARRYSRWLRPLYATAWSSELRRWATLIIRTIPEIWELLVLLVVFLTIFAVSGILLFSKFANYSGDESDQLQNFDNFPNAMMAMYVLFTSENYPDIMSTPFAIDEKYSHFFIVFLLMVMFFLGNLAVPTLYRAFKVNHHREALYGRILERTALLAAFQLLDVERNGFLERDRFKEILMEVRKDLFDHSGNEKQKGIVSFIFRELAQNDPHHEKIYAIDFFRTCEVILINYEVSHNNSSIDLYKFVCENMFMQNFKLYMRMILESTKWEYFSIITSGVVTLLMGFYNSGIIADKTVIMIGHIWVVVCFTEWFSKLYFLRAGYIWHGWEKKFDTMIAITSVCLLVAGKLGLLDRGYLGSGDEFCLIAVSLRSIRLIFMWNNLKKLNVILTIFPFMVNSLIVTLLFIYFWALGGMFLFAEVDLADPEVMECQAVFDTDIGFDNFASANLRLVQILSTSNWHLVMYGSICAFGSRIVAWYFVGFHFFTVVVLLQIVIAIYVEAFIAFQEQYDSEVVGRNMVKEFSQGDDDPPSSSSSDDEGKAGSGNGGENVLGNGVSFDFSKAATTRSRKVVRKMSVPGFVSPINMIARMDMPAFEDKEIEVLEKLDKGNRNHLVHNNFEKENVKKRGRLESKLEG